MSVAGVVAPVAVVVEIFIANDVLREVVSGARVVPTTIAAFRPSIELVGIADLLDVGIQRISAVEGGSLPGVDGIRLTIACGFALSIAKSDYRVAAIFARFNTIISGAIHVERQVWCVDLDRIVAI